MRTNSSWKAAHIALLAASFGAFAAASPVRAGYYIVDADNFIRVGPGQSIVFRPDTGFTTAVERTRFADAISKWNNPAGLMNVFSAAATGDSNSKFDHRSNYYEYGFAPSTTAFFAGTNGPASGSHQMESWIDGANSLRFTTGATVGVNDSYATTGTMDPFSLTLTQSESAMHELGHVLGLEHNNDALSIMCSSNTCGKFASQDTNGNNAAPGAVNIMPDDVATAAWFYGSGTPRVDPTVSPWNHPGSGGSAALIYGNGLEISLCRFAPSSVIVTLGNLGLKNITSADFAVVLSPDGSIAAYDTVAVAATFWLNAGSTMLVNIPFQVPNLTPGVYHVGMVVDSSNSLTEDNEGNNASRTGLRIKVLNC